MLTQKYINIHSKTEAKIESIRKQEEIWKIIYIQNFLDGNNH